MKNLKKLILLHSNDMHGDFMAESVDDKLVGGVSMLSGYVNKVRAEEENALYCIAGDMFRGSIIDSEFKGMSTIEIMNLLAPDVVTVGNHEVDYGVSHLLFIEKCAKFPIINANLHIKTNNARLFNPYKIIEIDGMKILFIGILTEEVLAQTKSDGLVGAFVNCQEAAVEVGKICNAYNSVDVDLTVLLTHIGFEEDKQLASILDPAWGVDVIIGGHSHTLPEEPAKVNDILIVQAGTGTDQIGRFDIIIDTDKNCIDSYEWKTIEITPDNCPRDIELEKLLHSYKETTDAKYNRVITRLARKHTHPKREQETEIGDFTADALKECLAVDIMMVASGSLRKPEMGPIVTYKDFLEMYPYDQPVYMFTVTGKQFRHMIMHMLRDEVWEGAHSEFYQLSEGVKIVYNKENHELETFTFMGEDIMDECRYTAALPEYHFKNFSDIFNLPYEEVRANGKERVISTSINQILEEYFAEHPMINQPVAGRIVLKGI